MSIVITPSTTDVVFSVNNTTALTLKETGVAAAGAAGVSGNDCAVVSQVIGVGQTWQAVTRTSGTTYTNTTGKPITWSFVQGAAVACTVVIGGVTLSSATTGASDLVKHTYIIPSQSTYSFTCTNVASHAELR